MFVWLYLGSFMDAMSKHPREAAAAIAAIVIIPEMHKRHTQVQLAKIKSVNDVEIARLERETAELKYKTAKLYEVDDTSQK